MKSNDLPVLPKSSRDTYDSVINDVEEVLVDELYASYPILVCHQLWDMAEKIDDVQLNVKIEIYETYHA